jgi:DNA-binding NtrC family response regulator
VGRFELADRGTLFLDEIANVPLKQQAKLLRVLETGEMERVGSSKTHRVDVRVLSATNADLKLESAEGRFRSDLLFRLNTVELHIPPLRERKEDIPLLAAHFLNQYAQRYRKPVKSFDPAALQKMMEHLWPGNVRELDHATERAVLMSVSEQIQPSDLGLESEKAAVAKIEDLSLEEVENLLIKKALSRHSGNISHAADALGLSRSALYRRMQKYGL